MTKKSNGWNLADMQATLVKDTEQKITDGFEEIAAENGERIVGEAAGMPSGEPLGTVAQPAAAPMVQPTKGVQTDVPMSDYQRLYLQKMTRDQNNKARNVRGKVTIGSLALEAILLWLDIQEGKAVVTYDTDNGSK